MARSSADQVFEVLGPLLSAAARQFLESEAGKRLLTEVEDVAVHHFLARLVSAPAALLRHLAENAGDPLAEARNDGSPG